MGTDRAAGRLRARRQFRDDAALLHPGGALVVNTDVLVETIHFSEATTSPYDVGWRAAAANLSDLAAMGCSEATGLTVGLVAPPATPWPWVEGVYGGLRACLEASAGGSCWAATAAAVGNGCWPSLPWVRCPMPIPGAPRWCAAAMAAPAITWSAAAAMASAVSVCAAAERRAGGPVRKPALHAGGAALAAHQRPRPRFDAVLALRQSRPATAPWRVGGTDSSDGLVAAAEAIGRASGCRVLLERSRLPLDPAMAPLPEAERWCLGGGEDFELVLALEPAWAEALVAALPGSRRIGSLAPPEPPLPAVGWLGDDTPLDQGSIGFQHFH